MQGLVICIHIKRYISITKTAAHSETFNVKNTLSALLKLIKFDIKDQI